MAMDLGKQVGPLPLGAWIVVVAGGLGIALYTSRQKVEEPETVDETGDVGVGPSGFTQLVPVQPPTENETGPATNEEWARIAIDGMISRGYPAALVNSAITKALMGGTDYEGKKMSVQEWSIWQLALLYYGTPPQPVNVPPPTDVPGPVIPPTNPPPTNPPPSPPPSTGTPAHYVYKSVRGDTLSGIASKTNKKYGLSNTWQTIYNFNLKYRSPATAAIIRARGPNLFYAGTTWWIPK
jgi:hypothetical protein